MGKSYKSIFLGLIVLLSYGSCSPRYIKYQMVVKKLRNNEITQEQFDKQFYKFYKTKKNYASTDTSLPVKIKGSYVNQDTDGQYRVCKFLANGKSVGSMKMGIYPNNITIQSSFSGESYYRFHNSNMIEIEYLQIRDWKVYNIVKTGKILGGDTILFFQSRTYQLPWLKPTKLNEVYVYDSTLTAKP